MSLELLFWYQLSVRGKILQFIILKLITIVDEGNLSVLQIMSSWQSKFSGCKGV